MEGRTCGELRENLVPQDLESLVAFVANYLAEFNESVETNDLILSGSFAAEACPVRIGGTAVANFGPLGLVSASLAAVDTQDENRRPTKR